jgi:prepilin-type N-terminal cleavage/methylation domain-containing protein
MKTGTNHKSGFTLVEIMIVVAIIGLLAAIAVPNFIRSRTKSQQNACISNIHQIDSAIQQWALETKQDVTASVATDGSEIAPYLGRSAGGSVGDVVCPSDTDKSFATSYLVSTVDEPPSCKINGGDHILY